MFELVLYNPKFYSPNRIMDAVDPFKGNSRQEKVDISNYTSLMKYKILKSICKVLCAKWLVLSGTLTSLNQGTQAHRTLQITKVVSVLQEKKKVGKDLVNSYHFHSELLTSHGTTSREC